MTKEILKEIKGENADLAYFKQKLMGLTLNNASDKDILAVRQQIEMLKETLGIVEDIDES